MITATLRRTDPRPFLPLVVLVVLLGTAALLAPIAPSLVTTGVYQVWVDGATITTESLSCQRLGDTSRCTAPVGGQELAVTVVRDDPQPIIPGTCTAVHGDRRVSCDALMADYGHASHSVRITALLGLTEADLAVWLDRMPWWRTPENLVKAGVPLIGLLGLVVGGAAFLMGGRVRPRHPWRPRVVIGTGLLGLVLFGVSARLMGAGTGAALLSTLIPPTLLGAAVLAAWQWRSSATSTGTVRARWAHAATAAAATVVYSIVAMVVFLLHGGFID